MFSLFMSAADRRPTVPFLLLMTLVLVWAVPGHAGSWKGEITKDADGVEHVMNPASPADGTTSLQPRELWRIGGETDDEDEIFGIISRARVDADGNLYLLDSQLSEIKVFDPDGNFLRSIGREGEGPGEFRGAQDMFFLPDGNLAVLQVFPGRLVGLTPEGEPVDDHPLPSAGEGGFVLLFAGGGVVGDKLALSIGVNHFESGVFDQERSVVVIDDAGEIVTKLYSEKRGLNMSAPVFKESTWNSFDRVWTVGSDHRAYIPTSWSEYRIMVCDENGTTRFIERAYEARKRSAAEKERWSKLYNEFTKNQVPGSHWEIEDNERDVMQIFAREDGSLWVLSSQGVFDRPDGSMGVFDVFDPQGHFVRQVTLMGDADPIKDGFFFEKDRLYVVTDFLAAAMSAQGGSTEALGEEEPEPMSVVCYQMPGLK